MHWSKNHYKCLTRTKTVSLRLGRILCARFVGVNCTEYVILYEAIKTELRSSFPSLEYKEDYENRLISIPSGHGEVGSLDIQDDFDELTIFIGNFTHWHCGYLDRKTGTKEQAKVIAQEVCDFLNDLFKDNIFIWNDGKSSGGFEFIDSEFKAKIKGFVWSGPYGS